MRQNTGAIPDGGLARHSVEEDPSPCLPPPKTDVPSHATRTCQNRTQASEAVVKSWYARLLAVRRISQDNRGKHTAGIDGVKSLTLAERWRLVQTLRLDNKATPLRRTWIPKRGSAEKHPLGIPICLAYCISLSNGFGNGHRLDPRRGSRRKLSIG